MDCLVCEMFGVWDVFGVGCLVSGLFFLSCCVVWGLWWSVLWCVLCGIVSVMCRSELSKADKYIFFLIVIHLITVIISRKYLHGSTTKLF